MHSGHAGLTVKEQAACLAAGFDLGALELHQQRVLKFLHDKTKPLFAILDTCRTDNGSIRTIPTGVPDTPSGFVAFVPAAGAASRYHVSILQLTGKEAPLVPKAILPAVREGQTFLELKIEEHSRMQGLVGQVFVAAAGQSPIFEKALQESSLSKSMPCKVIEQDASLSTVRFSTTGAVVFEADGTPSMVPAGHGALAATFPKCRDFFGTAHSLFIRNIDNVCGTRTAAVDATTRFLGFHQKVLNLVGGIRQLLAQGDWNGGKEQAQLLCAFVNIPIDPKWIPERILLEVLSILFHTPWYLFPTNAPVNGSDNTMLRSAIFQHFKRPVNTLGMVPNSGKDVGGTPVFARSSGNDLHLCLEVCHASPEDYAAFLSNPAKATHFNPVFVAAEIPVSPAIYGSMEHPFWTIAEKQYRGESVFYHETLLYEVIGNGMLSNCIFVEIPRSLFNPHKTVQDALGRSIDQWR